MKMALPFLAVNFMPSTLLTVSLLVGAVFEFAHLVGAGHGDPHVPRHIVGGNAKDDTC
jgi:hypothetical protein